MVQTGVPLRPAPPVILAGDGGGFGGIGLGKVLEEEKHGKGEVGLALFLLACGAACLNSRKGMADSRCIGRKTRCVCGGEGADNVGEEDLLNRLSQQYLTATASVKLDGHPHSARFVLRLSHNV